MSFPRIIGLLARSRSGKDTVCDYLICSHPQLKIVKTRLAKPIKDAVAALYGFTTHQIEGDSKDVIDTYVGISPRTAMVSITNEVMRLAGKDWFSRRCFDGFDEQLERNSKHTIIIPDVRYEHDLEEIRKRGGIIIKITRNSANIPRYEWENKIDTMDSDYTLTNDDTLDDLYLQVDLIIERHINRSSHESNQNE